MSSRTNALVFLIACGALPALPARERTPAWIELGPSGQVLARVVVNSPDACPVLQADRRPLPMQLRSPVPDGFLPACEALVPPKTHSLTLAGKPLRLPKTPRRVAVLGDTGCRVKGNQIQNCGDPAVWPFRAVAARIAAESPDLIIHVGDYLYRESPCPDPSRGCAGPSGDNWPAWKADFFEPAAAALSAAPWAFSRGNHEDCRRSWRGWFYYLDPRPFSNACATYTPNPTSRKAAVCVSACSTPPLSWKTEPAGARWSAMPHNCARSRARSPGSPITTRFGLSRAACPVAAP
ncbi:MAG TPA: metallophosphoesterase [Bryobacteraceae bacterium]|nr:metallophosphoesterase [Bryobacteraceae bacterium]